MLSNSFTLRDNQRLLAELDKMPRPDLFAIILRKRVTEPEHIEYKH